MARSQTLSTRTEILLGAACLGAHGSEATQGFRQREVKFLTDLFTNWVDSDVRGATPFLQNTQVARYLAELERDGFASRTGSGRLPLYKLTLRGVLELLNRLVRRDPRPSREQFLFLCYFIRSYRDAIEAHLASLAGRASQSTIANVHGMLDVRALIAAELAECRHDLKKLQRRHADAIEAATLARTMIGQGRTLDDTVRAIQKKHPYDLNAQRPLAELIASIPEELRMWELCEGRRVRAIEIWSPSIAMLETYIRELETLAADPSANGRFALARDSTPPATSRP